MLGKLTKYEFKATCRFFLPLYGALLLLAAMARLSQWIITYNEIGLLQYFSNIFTLVYVAGGHRHLRADAHRHDPAVL